MNDDTAAADLKQFIAAAISQQTVDFRARFDAIEQRMVTKDEAKAMLSATEARLSAQIQDLQASVAEAVDTSNDATDEQLRNHEQRITRLEHASAPSA